ncbi:Uncharacterised protein [Bordetella pertussis]|nr:Uncharacterised protein [Bordetella pertussis]
MCASSGSSPRSVRSMRCMRRWKMASPLPAMST